MVQETNVFSDSKSNISILVYTEGFINDKEAIQYFCNANKLRGINIYFMPILSNTSDIEVEFGKYYHYREKKMVHSSISFSDCSSIVSMHRGVDIGVTDIEISQLTEKCIISGQIATDLFNYIIVNKNLPSKEKCNVPVVSLAQCKEILRLFLIKNKTFLISERFSIDETYYYIYKHKQLFYEFQNFWSVVCKDKEVGKWADALDNRLKLITICLDQCKIEAYKLQNNTTIMYLKYHLSYLLLLITGTFDNLAWLIDNLYILKLNCMKIDLRKKDFKKAIERKSQVIYDILINSSTAKVIYVIRELRDCIVHREFIQAVSVPNMSNKFENSCLFLDNEISELLIDAGFSNEGVKISTKDYSCIDVLEFIGFIERVTINIVNDLVKIIAEEIYKSKNTYVIWEMVDFPTEPYVL